MYHIDMEKEKAKKSIIEFLKNHGGYARMKDFKEEAFRPSDIKRLVDEGKIDKIKAGLYRAAELEFPADVGIGFVDVSKAIILYSWPEPVRSRRTI